MTQNTKSPGLVDSMEAAGVVSSPGYNGSREVLGRAHIIQSLSDT